MKKIATVLLTIMFMTTAPVMAGDPQINDPWENYNRAMFKTNVSLDTKFIRPVAKAWRENTSQSVQNSARNFFQNLSTPLIIINNLLQGELHKAGDNTIRFVGNTTLGLFGLFDVVSHKGPKHEPADFGQTLAKWGVGEGPVFVMPIIGTPQPLRDTTSNTAISLVDPATKNVSLAGKMTGRYLKTVDERTRDVDLIETVERNSQDFYAAARSSMLQSRRAFLKGNELTVEEDEDDPFADVDESDSKK